MEFSLTDEQKTLRDEVERFAAAEIAPGVEQREEEQGFSRATWKKIADMGLAGVCVPERYGGTGLDALSTVIALEAFARGSRDSSMVLVLSTHLLIGCMPIVELGSDAQKSKYLPDMAGGKKLGAFALTEPGSGSDATGLKATARRDGDHYVLNGSKTFISNAPIADVFVVFASTDPSREAAGISAFIVEMGSPGLTAGKPLRKYGGHAAPTGELFFDDCRVPAGNMLGEEGTGFRAMLRALGWERLFVAPLVGQMEADLKACVEYSKQRVQFGRPICEFELVQAMLAEMKIDLEASRYLSYHTAWKLSRGEDIALDAAIAKTFVSEAAERSASKAVQVFGGYGCMREYPVGRSLWMSKMATIGGGTSQIQRTIIGRMLTR